MSSGNWISLGIFIIGLLSLVYAIWMNKKQNGARILFRLVKRQNSEFYEFTIKNTGNQDAENFSFLIDGKDPVQYDYILFDLKSLIIIRAGASHSKRIAGPRKGLSVIRVSASFRDRNGNHEIEQTLNF